MPIPAVILAAPYLPYIITFVLATLGIGLFASVLRIFQVTIAHLVLLGAGLYIILWQVLPKISDVDEDNKAFFVFLAVLGLVFVLLGVPNLIFSSLGQPYTYTIIPP